MVGFVVHADHRYRMASSDFRSALRHFPGYGYRLRHFLVAPGWLSRAVPPGPRRISHVPC